MIVGLTGGIGSGKSTVANMFKELGVPIYIADAVAKELMQSSATIKKKIIETFGEKVIKNNVLDRKYLAALVFSDVSKLAQLNSIIHPEVAKDFQKWYKKQTSLYVIYEAAILFESGGYKKCDTIITVTAPIKERIQRVIKRDNTTAEAVEKRIQNQWTDSKKIARSNFVITNTDLQKTQKQVVKIHKNILKTATIA